MKKRELHIVADAHIWGVASAFSSIPGFDVDLCVLENREITHEALKDAEILLTRSSTRVDAALLEGTPVRFAATATIGDDHYDKAWLLANGITWATAAGSSTGSVIEYMITALLELHMRRLISIPATTLGIVGVGRIGSTLAKVCAAMGMNLLLNDPPRERLETDVGFSSVDQLLEEADLVTLHTPLIHDGEDKTAHLVDAEFLAAFRGKGIINAARGVCVDNEALADWLDCSSDRFAVLDCWEGEPNISRRLLAHPQMVIATPHIAGHSLDGKAANTQYIYNALCRYLETEPAWRMACELPAVEDLYEIGCSGDLWSDLHAMATTLYPIMRDDAEMRRWSALSDCGLARAFASFRRHYPVRRAWDQICMKMQNGNESLAVMAHQMGMHVLGCRS